MLRATLTFVKRQEALTTARHLAALDADDLDFLQRHVDRLRDATSAEAALRSRFQHESGVPGMLTARQVAAKGTRRLFRQEEDGRAMR